MIVSILLSAEKADSFCILKGFIFSGATIEFFSISIVFLLVCWLLDMNDVLFADHVRVKGPHAVPTGYEIITNPSGWGANIVVVSLHDSRGLFCFYVCALFIWTELFVLLNVLLSILILR